MDEVTRVIGDGQATVISDALVTVNNFTSVILETVEIHC